MTPPPRRCLQLCVAACPYKMRLILYGRARGGVQHGPGAPPRSPIPHKGTRLMAELIAPTGQTTRSVAAMARRTMRALGTDPAYIGLAYRDPLDEAILLRH